MANLETLGELVTLLGDARSALSLNNSSLSIARELGDRRGIAAALEGQVAIATALGDPLRAARISGAAERMREEMDTPIRPNARLQYDQALAAARACVDYDAFNRAWQEGQALSDERAIELALAQIVRRHD